MNAPKTLSSAAGDAKPVGEIAELPELGTVVEWMTALGVKPTSLDRHIIEGFSAEGDE